MNQECHHCWESDPESLQFEECSLYGAIRRAHTICPACGGRRWTAEMHDDPRGGKKPEYRNPCGMCQATGLVPLDPPKVL